MKKLLISCSVFIVFCLAVGCYYYTPYGLFARCYCGNRIEINIYSNVDDKFSKIDLNDSFMTNNEENIYESANNRTKLSKHKDHYKLKCKTNGYGSHKFYIMVDNKYPIVINIYMWNWWDIQRINLYIDINAKDNTITYYNNYCDLSENAKKCYYKSDKTTDNISSINTIWAGAE